MKTNQKQSGDSDSDNFEEELNLEQEQDLFCLLPEANPIAPKNQQQEKPLQNAYSFSFEDLPCIDHSIQQRKDVLQFRQGQNKSNFLSQLDVNLQNLMQDNQSLVFRRLGQKMPLSQQYSMCLINLKKLFAKKKGDSVLTYKLNPENNLPVHENIDENTLIFESRFESGNLARATKAGDFEYQLLIQNDINTKGYSQWFYFRVSNFKLGETYKFNILNFSKSGYLFTEGMKISVFSTRAYNEEKRSWFKAGNNISANKINLVYSSGEYGTFYNLYFEYKFEFQDDEVFFAYNQPYTYTDLKNYLAEKEKELVDSSIMTRRILCKTIAGNTIDLLTITNRCKSENQLKNKRGIIMTARVHPGEPVSSFMMKGFLDFILGNTEEAIKLRELFIFKIVPMLNPDGVIHGNYRCSLAGNDLNRRWLNPDKTLHPEIFYTKMMILQFSQRNKVSMYMDMHGHSRKKNIFIYGCHDPLNPLSSREFPFILSKINPNFSFRDCNFAVQEAKEGTARISLWKELDCNNIFTIESSFCGSSIDCYHFTSQDLEKMGRSILEGIFLKWKVKKVVIEEASRDLGGADQVSDLGYSSQSNLNQSSKSGSKKQEKKEKLNQEKEKVQEKLNEKEKEKFQEKQLEKAQEKKARWQNTSVLERERFQSLNSQTIQQFGVPFQDSLKSVQNLESDQQPEVSGKAIQRLEFQKEGFMEVFTEDFFDCQVGEEGAQENAESDEFLGELYQNKEQYKEQGNSLSQGSDSAPSVDKLDVKQLEELMPNKKKRKGGGAGGGGGGSSPLKDSKSCMINEKFSQSKGKKIQSLEIQNCNKVKYLKLQQQQQQFLVQQQEKAQKAAQARCKLCLKVHQESQVEYCAQQQEVLRQKAKNKKYDKLYNFIGGSSPEAKKQKGSAQSPEKEFKISILEPKFINFPLKAPDNQGSGQDWNPKLRARAANSLNQVSKEASKNIFYNQLQFMQQEQKLLSKLQRLGSKNQNSSQIQINQNQATSNSTQPIVFQQQFNQTAYFTENCKKWQHPNNYSANITNNNSQIQNFTSNANNGGTAASEKNTILHSALNGFDQTQYNNQQFVNQRIRNNFYNNMQKTTENFLNRTQADLEIEYQQQIEKKYQQRNNSTQAANRRNKFLQTNQENLKNKNYSQPNQELNTTQNRIFQNPLSSQFQLETANEERNFLRNNNHVFNPFRNNKQNSKQKAKNYFLKQEDSKIKSPKNNIINLNTNYNNNSILNNSNHLITANLNNNNFKNKIYPYNAITYNNNLQNKIQIEQNFLQK